MHLDGQVWFSFTNPDVWIFYRFVRELASSGAAVNLDWVPLPSEHEAASMSTFLAIDDPDGRGRFLHAMLGLIHLEGERFDDEAIVARALAASGASAHDRQAGEDMLPILADDAAALGVTKTPSLYRHGPASHIRLTEAALMGDATETAAAMLSIVSDDGVWSIVKP